MPKPRAAPLPPPPRIPRIESVGRPSPELEVADASRPTQPAPPAESETRSAAHFPKSCPQCRGRYPADFRVCPRDATPLEDAPEGEDPLLGTVLAGSYEITRVIGEGGMGRVYEARHQRLHNKRYAVKMLHDELSRQPDVVTRFQREAEAASALEHPNVVAVHDVNRTNAGRPYIVAELLQGEQLGDYLDRVGKISAEQAAQLIRPVCRALGVAHSRGIVHRDVKPENVFLAGDPENVTAKVLDFGISKVGETSGTLTKTGMVMGTPGYIAPEQARGDRVDFRADIYALGAILYRAVTGRKPFEDLDPMAAVTAVLVEEPPRPSSIEPSVPPAFELVIQRAMAKNPADRFASMEDLEVALEAFDTGEAAVEPSVESAEGEQPSAPIGNARTVISKRGNGSSDTLAVVTRNVKLARPTIALFTVTGLLWVLGISIDLLSGVIRLVYDRQLTSAEVNLSMLSAIILTGAVGTPWIKYIRKIWSNTPRAIETALRVRRTILFSAAGYGVAALTIDLLHTVLYRPAEDVASPYWNLVLFAVALLVGVLTWVSGALATVRSGS
jgi:serine/threonine-protein kinase